MTQARVKAPGARNPFGIVVDDLAAATEFFLELGLVLHGG
jgi:hypothetical protein